LFCETDYGGKRILAGSSFSKKLLFGNNNCRTTEVKKELGLLTRNSKGFDDDEKKKSLQKRRLFRLVPEGPIYRTFWMIFSKLKR